MPARGVFFQSASLMLIGRYEATAFDFQPWSVNIVSKMSIPFGISRALGCGKEIFVDIIFPYRLVSESLQELLADQ